MGLFFKGSCMLSTPKQFGRHLILKCLQHSTSGLTCAMLEQAVIPSSEHSRGLGLLNTKVTIPPCCET